MASTEKNYRTYGYVQGAVQGSLAYDFDNPNLIPEIGFEAPPERVAPPRTAPAPRVRPRVQTRQSIAPFTVVGFVCATVLIIFSLMSRIQLSTISDETVKIQQRVEKLREEEIKLKIAYESAFNLAEIEQFAINELGMQKPRSDQIYYIDGSTSNRAFIYSSRTVESNALDWFGDILSQLAEYFKWQRV